MEDQFIGSYRVLKKIGAGGMAKVYLAVHQDVPNLKVILKILSDPRLGERFKQEADKLALLDGHPNICRIKHFFNHGEDTVIAMEYIEGITLDKKIENEGKLPTEESLQILSDVLDILDFAHQKGIYHRDIKPSNIMINKKGHIKIIDFGIAKAETDPSLTVAGAACGTPAYMAPEQFTPTHDTNYALVDIYAAGTTLYVMLTGECPFKGDNEFAIRDAKLFSDIAKPRSLNPDIPKQVEEIIMKSLAKEPTERFQSASEMLRALETTRGEMKGGIPTNRTGLTVEIPPGLRKTTEKKKKALPVGVAIAFVILVLSGFTVYYFLGTGYKAGTIDINVLPRGDVYVDGSLLGMSITAISFTGTSGMHVLRVYNEETDEKTLYDTVWLAADTVVPLTFEFTMPPLTGTINISVRPWGSIYVDDSLLGDSVENTSLVADTGRHIIRVENRKATRKVLHDTIQLAADEVLRRSYRFTIPSPVIKRQQPVSVFGSVIVWSSPRDADVYIDGKLREGRTPNTFKVKPGDHTVTVKKNVQGEILTGEDTFLVKKDSISKVILDLKK